MSDEPVEQRLDPVALLGNLVKLFLAQVAEVKGDVPQALHLRGLSRPEPSAMFAVMDAPARCI